MAASPDSGKVVRNQYRQGSSQNAQPPAGPALAASPGGGEGSQKSILWPARLPASRGPVKTLSRRPARRCRQAPASGKVFRNHNRGQNFAYIQNSCPEAPARRCRQALTAGRLSEINTGARNSPPFKTRARRLWPGVETSTGGGEGCQKSTQGPWDHGPGR